MSWDGFDTAWLAAHSKRMEAGTRQKAATTRTQPEPVSVVPEPGIVDPGQRQGPKTGGDVIYLAVTPYPKPRMTRRDTWMRRPAVLRYRAFCDAVRAAWPEGVPYPEAGAHITFYLPMPKSWSRAKRDAMRGKAHRQRPDRDNLEKALLDALHSDDCAVWDGRTTKRWADVGYIEITLNEATP